MTAIESPLGVIATLSREEMLARSRARDRALDGRVLVGVTSTGIYCLPSCPARKPKPENTAFFESEPEARRAGLRPCKRCRPDRFLRGHDPELELAASLAQRVRRAPGEFTDVASLAAAAGIGATKLGELLRRYFHTTPADFLVQARVRVAASELAQSSRKLVDVALDAGFESSSTFHENFRRLMALTPAAWRGVGESDGFVLGLPDGFRRDDVLAHFGRDPAGATERVSGSRAEKALVLDGTPVRLSFEFSAARVRVRVLARTRPRPELMRAAHPLALRVLGLRGDPDAFERRARRAGFARLVSRRPGLRIPQTADAFEGLLWVVVGQQVNVAFASLCRSRLIELCRMDAGDGLLAHPTAREVAQLDYDALTGLQFSRSKAEFVIDAARQITGGELDLEGLRDEPAARVEKRLSDVRGLGPWSVQYLLMKSYGLADCVPVGDSGLATALQRFFDLDERPDPGRMRKLMEPFAPHRSFATLHLWKTLGDPT